MPNKEFLEEYPLFKKYKAEFPRGLNHFSRPAINMQCRDCGTEQTFSMTNRYSSIASEEANDKKVTLEYLCQSCRKFTRQFQIYISSDLSYCYKFGQYPEWEIKIDKSIDQALGKHVGTFKKGLVCESQGYGIGAFAYFRRITEEIIDELLESIADLIEFENKEKYSIALEATKKTRVTQDKIDLVKDLLPSILRPNDMNPLGVLHSELSEGLHAESDEACLEIAGHIKSILLFLINQISTSKQASKQFTSSMKALLEKKSIY